LSRTTLAVDAQEVAAKLPQRVVSMRLFRGNVHRLALLALVEGSVALLAVVAAIFVRFSGFSSTFLAFEHTVGPIWPRPSPPCRRRSAM